MRTFNVLLAVAGAALVATCSSSLSPPAGGADGATGGSSGLGGANGLGGFGGLGFGGAGGMFVLCGAGGDGLGGFGGTNGLGGANGLGGFGGAGCVLDPLAGCPASPASSPCGSGAVCAYSSQDGRIELNTCMPVPSGCDSCACLENALVDFAKQFQDISVPVGACGCYEGQQQVDGGTPANPIGRINCNGA